MDDPEESAARDERHAEHRLNALFQQDGVDNSVRTHVIERHGSSRGGDPTGETPADRHPHALMDLLVEATSRPGDEVGATLIEEQHRHRVDAQDLLDTCQ